MEIRKIDVSEDITSIIFRKMQVSKNIGKKVLLEDVKEGIFLGKISRANEYNTYILSQDDGKERFFSYENLKELRVIKPSE